MTSYRHIDVFLMFESLLFAGDDTNQQIKARVLEKLGCGQAFWLEGTSQTIAGNNASGFPKIFQMIQINLNF